MDNSEFDQALVSAAFTLAAADGWRAVSVAAAARAGGLDLARARARFSGPDAILLRFNRHADQAALTGGVTNGSARDKLFELLMRRVDAIQEHRAGVIAVCRALPAYPALALMLAAATQRSMAWMLDAAEISSAGLPGMLRCQGLAAVWLYGLRAWEQDDSADLVGTMAALDRALTRAEQVAHWLASPGAPPGPKPFPEVPPTAA